jgi:hypothetical protein
MEGSKMSIEQLREQAMALCAARGIAVYPYAGGWWLVSTGISRVVGELAGLCNSDLVPLPVRLRPRHQVQPETIFAERLDALSSGSQSYRS